MARPVIRMGPHIDRDGYDAVTAIERRVPGVKFIGFFPADDVPGQLWLLIACNDDTSVHLADTIAKEHGFNMKSHGEIRDEPKIVYSLQPPTEIWAVVPTDTDDFNIESLWWSEEQAQQEAERLRNSDPPRQVGISPRIVKGTNDTTPQTIM